MERRPMVMWVLAYAAGIVVQHMTKSYVEVIILLCASVISAVVVWKSVKNKRGVWICILFLAAGCICGVIDENRESKLIGCYGDFVSQTAVNESLEDNKNYITMECRVMGVEAKNDGYALIVKEFETGEKVLVRVEGKQYDYNFQQLDEINAVKSEVNSVKSKEVLERASHMVGKVICVGGAVERPSKANNPGGFDYSLYLRGMGILSIMSVKEGDVQLLEGNKPRGIWKIMNVLGVLKGNFESEVFSRMNAETAGLLCGVMFGDDGLMEESLQDTFRNAGTGHLLAVSGLHVGMVYAVFYALMGKPVSILGNIPLMIMMVGYSALSGFSPSVVRAVFMIFVHIVAKVTHRRYDFLTCIAFCGGVILFVSPMKLFSSGFQLSFMAVLSLSVVMKKIEKFFKMPQLPDPESEYITLRDYILFNLKRRFISFICVTVSLQLGLMPLTIFTFHYFSPAGLVVNSPAIALAGVILPLGLLLGGSWLAAGTVGILISAGMADFLTTLFHQVYIFCFKMTEMLIKILVDINTFANNAIKIRYIATPPVTLLLLYYFLLFFCCSEMGTAYIRNVKKTLVLALTVEPEGSCLKIWDKIVVMFRASKQTIILFLGVVILCLGVGIADNWEYLCAEAVFVDVGQGDCCHIKGTNGVDIMCDSGGSEMKDVGTDVLIPYFLGRGISSLDLVVISHLHTDHYEGLKTMTAGVKVKKLLLAATYKSQAGIISKETGIPEENMIFASAGDVVNVGGGIIINVLAPVRKSGIEYEKILEDEKDENQICLVTQVCCKGKKVLFTGDIDMEFEEILGEQWREKLSSEVLKVPHHGSKFSSGNDFLKQVEPDICMIQVGRNVYGHPTQDAINRIKDSGALIFRNDKQGAVMMDFDGKIKVRTMKS